MGLFGMAAAQMLFDDDDHLWHLYSSGEFLKSRRMLPQSGDDVHLVEIPVLLRGLVSPALTDLKDISDVQVALERTRRLRLSEKLDASRSFMLGSLSPAERRVINLLASEGLSDLDLAARLHLSPRTVEQHLRSAYLKASEHWDLDNVTRAQLIALLGPYFTFTAPKIGGNPHDSKTLIH